MLLAVAAACAFPAAAAARTAVAVLGPAASIQGPFVGGDGVVWVVTRADHATADVVTKAPHAAARIIATVPARVAGANEDQLLVKISGEYLAYSSVAGNVTDKSATLQPVSTEVDAGPLAGPYRRLSYCRGAGPNLGSDNGTPFSLSGSLIGFAAGCASPTPVQVVDLATGGKSQIAVAPAYHDLRVAGDFLALQRTGQTPITVYDRTSGAPLYAIELPGPAAVFGTEGFDLQADGKLAASVDGRVAPGIIAASIVWFSPAAPTAHVVPEPQVPAVLDPFFLLYAPLPVRIADDTLVYTRPENPCVSPTPAGIDLHEAVTDLVASDLAGNVRLIDRVVGTSHVQFDFDGQTVAWLGNQNGLATVLRQNLSTDVPPPAPADPQACRTALAPAARVVERAISVSRTARRAAVQIACLDRAGPGERSTGCGVGVDIRSVRRVRLRPGARLAILQFTTGGPGPGPALNLLPGDQGTVPIVLDAAKRALLRRVHGLPVRVTVTGAFSSVVLARTVITLIARP